MENLTLSPVDFCRPAQPVARRGPIQYNHPFIPGIPTGLQRGPDIDDQFSYRIRRSRRATRARLVVTADTVKVVAPLAMTEADVHAFVDRYRDWIDKTRRRLETRIASLPPLAPASFEDGAPIPFQGAFWPLRLSETPRRRPCVGFADAFSVAVPSGTAAAERDGVVKQALVHWFKARALLEAERLSTRHGVTFGLVPRSVRVREQRTRWGSCGIRNDIQLNWRLIFAPESVLEYVVVHELCHIRHRNHSVHFWGLVEAHLPDYRHRRRWLREHGARLMRDF